MEPDRHGPEETGLEQSGHSGPRSRKAWRPSLAPAVALLLSGWAACAVVLAVVTALWAHRARDVTLSTARADVLASAASGANAAGNLLGLIDVVLARLSELASDARFEDVDKLCPSPVCSNLQRLSPYLLLAFARPNGDLVTYGPDVPQVNIADRDYFVVQKERDAGLFVSAARPIAFMTGPALLMSRRLSSKNGAFEGIVGAAISADQLWVMFQGLGAGKADRIGLLNARGLPLVEWTSEAGAPCEPAGSTASPDTFVAREKLRVGDLTVETCRSRSNALRAWREEVYLVAGSMGLLLAAAALALPLINRRRTKRLRQQMGLHGLVTGSSDVQFIIEAKPDGRFVLEAISFTRPGELGRMSARLVGRTTREFFAPEDVEAIEADYRSVLASGQTRRSVRRVRLGSEEFNWSTVLVPLNDPGGRGSYIFGAATELTGLDADEMQGGLRLFTEDMLRREDAERRRIARELHDTTGQNLIAAGFELGTVERGVSDPPPQVRSALSRVRALIEGSVRELRTLAYVLHPALLDEAGLGIALPTLAEGMERRADVRITVAVAPELAGLRWPPEIEIALYRVAQEALTNVQRHSVSKTARVALRSSAPERMELVVEDGTGGSGINPPVSPVVEGAGIRAMRERIEAVGGTLSVSHYDGGFRVEATVPSGPGGPEL